MDTPAAISTFLQVADYDLVAHALQKGTEHKCLNHYRSSLASVPVGREQVLVSIAIGRREDVEAKRPQRFAGKCSIDRVAKIGFGMAQRPPERQRVAVDFDDAIERPRGARPMIRS